MSETAWARRIRLETERAAHVAEHGNLCELCGNPPKSRGLAEDHDHKTGAHRGWLCFRCNRALPAYVTLEWLLRAALYLMPREWATRRELEWVLREAQQMQAEAAR
jgi:hypothetical protein